MTDNGSTFERDAALTAYALGELDADAAVDVERRLGHDAEARAHIDAVRAIADDLRAVYEDEAVPGLRSDQRDAILAPAPLPMRRRHRGNVARLVLAAAMVAIAALIVVPLSRPADSEGDREIAMDTRRNDAARERVAGAVPEAGEAAPPVAMKAGARAAEAETVVAQTADADLADERRFEPAVGPEPAPQTARLDRTGAIRDEAMVATNAGVEAGAGGYLAGHDVTATIECAWVDAPAPLTRAGDETDGAMLPRSAASRRVAAPEGRSGVVAPQVSAEVAIAPGQPDRRLVHVQAAADPASAARLVLEFPAANVADPRVLPGASPIVREGISTTWHAVAVGGQVSLCALVRPLPVDPLAPLLVARLENQQGVPMAVSFAYDRLVAADDASPIFQLAATQAILLQMQGGEVAPAPPVLEQLDRMWRNAAAAAPAAQAATCNTLGVQVQQWVEQQPAEDPADAPTDAPNP